MRRKPSRRLWSARRTPAALAALVMLFCAGMLLFDVVQVRAGQPAAAWRKGLFDELASRPLDDVWMLAGAATAAALGLWLIVLALTPGLRRRLPLQVPAGRGRTRATLDRDSAAQLLRDATLRVPGVSRARVRVRRHRTRVRADVRFRDPHDVKSEIVAAVRDEQRNRLALAHSPKPRVRARRST
ncbi:DUF6286 domain-containing protein [Streptomyces sp. MI02-7b]|uniref:DUF6286 domain-containing protein n=1 Tax=Streptomyces sp. MI02-7b TaxID=462941 RepID=UPI0029AB8C56|nr:DUF6286 domain-containing protein [Streptomyces sp. MI02-7b]MDX3075472.1 DUF6286 domain-containing protein [Streptomyces sp. MI02-7b]